jgi:hypothetical protein
LHHEGAWSLRAAIDFEDFILMKMTHLRIMGAKCKSWDLTRDLMWIREFWF